MIDPVRQRRNRTSGVEDDHERRGGDGAHKVKYQQREGRQAVCQEYGHA